MLADKSGDWLYLLELDVYYVLLLINRKLRQLSCYNIQRKMAVDDYYNVYIYTAQVRPFV